MFNASSFSISWQIFSLEGKRNYYIDVVYTFGGFFIPNLRNLLVFLLLLCCIIIIQNKCKVAHTITQFKHMKHDWVIIQGVIHIAYVSGMPQSVKLSIWWRSSAVTRSVTITYHKFFSRFHRVLLINDTRYTHYPFSG